MRPNDSDYSDTSAPTHDAVSGQEASAKPQGVNRPSGLARALAGLTSLFLVGMALLTFYTGHAYSLGNKLMHGPVDFQGPQAQVIAWAMLAIALLPLGMFAKTSRAAITWGVFSFVVIMCSVFIPLIMMKATH